MNVQLAIFSKKRNSTATFSGTTVSKDGVLREGCSIIKPVIGFAIPRTSSPSNYNYARIGTWLRSYFIQDWVWEDGRWWAYMEVDVMGSFKAGIGASSCYVLRAYAERDPDILDCLYPTKIVETIKTDIDDGPWFANTFDTGTYIIGVLGNSGTIGAVNYYALTPAEMGSFRSALMSNVQSLVGTTEITDELLKALFNPFQYVVSAVWVPIQKQYLPTSGSGNIRLGWWDTGATGTTLSNYHWEDDYDFTFYIGLPSVSDKYLLAEPYSSYSFFFPPFGSVELDSGILLANYDAEVTGYPVECHAHIVVDLITGMGFMQVLSMGNIIAYKEAIVGVPTQLGQSTQDILGGIQGVISGIGDIASGAAGMFTGTGGISQITSGLNGIIDAGRSVVPKVQTSGNNGGLGALQFHPYLQVSRRAVVDKNPQENGFPLCKTRTISSLSGYIKTMNSDIVIPNATDAEQEQVRAMMNGGFFYE